MGGVKMKKDEVVGGVASPSTVPGSKTESVRQSKSSQNTKRDIPIPPKSGEAHGRQSSSKIVGIAVASDGAGACEQTSIQIAAKVLFPVPTNMEVKEAELGPADGQEGGSTSPMKRQSKRTPRNAGGRPPKKKKTEVRPTPQPVHFLWACNEISGPKVCVGMLHQKHATFHGSLVPDQHCVVCVTEVKVLEYKLPYPNEEDEPPQITMGDTIGSLVLWPSENVTS
ncbi:unnamed protein product [Calypogeia fissa]